jgi:hypothetical protein
MPETMPVSRVAATTATRRAGGPPPRRIDEVARRHVAGCAEVLGEGEVDQALESLGVDETREELVER